VSRERTLRNQRRAAADQQHRNVDSENQERAESLGASPIPAATPRYADAGIVVTEMATPTAEIALV